MKSFRKASPIMAAVLAAAFAPAWAQDEPSVAQLKAPDSVAGVGLGYVSDDNQRFGQYNGLNEKGGYLLLDADVVRRYDETGTWLRFNARNLGLDSRELRFGQERQGDWSYFIDYSQLPRFDPYTVNTGLQGIGSTTQVQNLVPRGGGTDYHLDTERKRWTLGGSKALARGLSASVVYRTEDKDGNRLFGQGTFGNWRFLVDPIDQTTQQLDAKLSYNTGKLQLVGGYYGTRFENRNNVINVSAVAPLGAPPFPEVALPPDNFSHQLYVNGGYNFTPTTRAMFKLSRGRITQDESFPVPAVAGAPGNLGGRIDTTLAEAGLTTRPTQKLTLRANLRYENRDDKTPVFRYYPTQDVANSTNNGENEPRDIKTTAAKLDGTYQLPAHFNLNAGVEYVKKERNSPPVRSVSFREETNETILSAGVRRRIGETATGSLTLLHSKRDGSDYLTNVRNDGTTLYSNAIAPLHLADRDRNTVRATLNWMPTEPLSLNFRADYSKDDYTGRTTTGFELGPRKGEGQFFSVDAAYAFSERWQATAWLSHGVNRYENATCQTSPPAQSCNATAAAPVWGGKLTNTDDSLGLGLRATVSAALKLGADVMYSQVQDEMGVLFFTTPSAANAAGAVLPDITTKVTTLKVYGEYAMRKNTTLRVQWIHDQYKTDDWTWQNWAYSDGTTVTQNPNQTVNFLGAAVLLHF